MSSSNNSNSLQQQQQLQLSPRPSPSTEQQSSQKLHPIYQALDTHNYTKALKLTSSDNVGTNSSNQWDIIRALRVHALERCGKTREALVLLWEILVTNVVVSEDKEAEEEKKNKSSSKECWSELYQRIVSLSDVEDVINSSQQGGGGASDGGLLDVQLVDAVQRLDSTSHVPIPLPKPSSPALATTNTTTSNNNNNKPASKSKSKKNSSSKSKSKKSSSSSSNKNTSSSLVKLLLPPVTDETVLQTINVTLRTLGMYDTMSYMYYIAMESIGLELTVNNKGSNSGSSKNEKNEVDLENYKCILQEGILVHFKSVCDCSNVGSGDGLDIVDKNGNTKTNEKNNNEEDHCNEEDERMVQCQLYKLETLLKLTTYYERMQTCKLLGFFVCFFFD